MINTKKKFNITIAIVIICTIITFAIPSFAFEQSQETGSNGAQAQAEAEAIGNYDNHGTYGINGPLVNFPEQKDITTTRNEGHGYRGYANPAEVHYPGTPGYFGNATRGASFEDAKTILKYKKSFGTDELKKMAKSGFGSKVIVTPLVDKVAKDKRADVISIYITDPTPKPELLGYVTAKATGNNVVSMDILAEAALAARELGGNAIQVSGEGVERSLQSFGWGIGLAYTGAHINNDETSSSVAAGGTGIAGGSAGYHDRPWVQIFILNVK